MKVRSKGHETAGKKPVDVRSMLDDTPPPAESLLTDDPAAAAPTAETREHGGIKYDLMPAGTGWLAFAHQDQGLPHHLEIFWPSLEGCALRMEGQIYRAQQLQGLRFRLDATAIELVETKRQLAIVTEEERRVREHRDDLRALLSLDVHGRTHNELLQLKQTVGK